MQADEPLYVRSFISWAYTGVLPDMKDDCIAGFWKFGTTLQAPLYANEVMYVLVSQPKIPAMTV